MTLVAAACRALLPRFSAVQCSLNAIYDLGTLFLVSAYSSGPARCGQYVRMTLIPPIVWAVIWLGVSLFTLLWLSKL